jgi:hypothetical protein
MSDRVLTLDERIEAKLNSSVTAPTTRELVTDMAAEIARLREEVEAVTGPAVGAAWLSLWMQGHDMPVRKVREVLEKARAARDES